LYESQLITGVKGPGLDASVVHGLDGAAGAGTKEQPAQQEITAEETYVAGCRCHIHLRTARLVQVASEGRLDVNIPHAASGEVPLPDVNW